MKPTMKTITEAVMVMYETTLPTWLISCVSGVFFCLMWATSWEIFPISVFSAVATTTPIPLPLVTIVEA